MGLTGRQLEHDRQAVGVDQGMDLGGRLRRIPDIQCRKLKNPRVGRSIPPLTTTTPL
jgi:hypothetical protein